MTTPGRDPLPRLADALTEVSSRLRDIGAELRTLQAPIAQAAPAAPTATAPSPFYPYAPPPGAWPPASPYAPPPGAWTPPPAHPSPLPPPPGAWTPPPYARYPQPPQRFAPPSPPRATLWDRLSREGAGSKLLAWIGGGVTLAGVVLLLVLAIQRGYIGPLPRVLAGAALGLALVGVGLFLHRSAAGQVGARAVAATGFAGLYLDVIAATSFYSYLPPLTGLFAGLAVAAAGVAVAARWDSQSFAVFVVAGCAVSAPLLTGGFVPLLVGFLLVLQIAATPVQLAKRWNGLAAVAAIPPVAAVLAEVAVAHINGAHVPAVVALCVTTSAVQVAFAIAAALRSADRAVATGLVASAPVPTLIGVSLVSSGTGALVVAALGAVLALVWTLHRARLLPVSDAFGWAAGAGAALSLFEAACLAFDGSVRAASLLAGGVLLAVLARQLRYAGALVPATVFAGVGALLSLDGPLRPDYLAHAPRTDVPLATAVGAGTTGAVLAVAAIALAWAAGRLMRPDSEADRARWIGAALAALYGVTGTLLSIGLAVAPDSRGFLAGHVLVTVSWTMGALVLLLRHVDSTPLRVAGLALVGAAVVKLVGFDLSSLSGIPRVLAFLGAGLVLLAAGARYAALVADRSRRADQEPVPSA